MRQAGRRMVSDSTLLKWLRTPRRVRLYGDLVRVAIAAAVSLWILFVATQHAAVGRFMFDRLHMNDFGKFYDSSRAYLSGTAMYGSSRATKLSVSAAETREFWNLNPPHFHLIVLPLATLDRAPALVVWLVLNVAAFALAGRWVGRELGIRWTAPGVLWTIAILISTSIAGILVVTGQLTGLLTLLMVHAWRRARRQRWLAAALWVGLATSLKPFLALLCLHLAFTRRWAPLAVAGASIAASYSVGLLVFGWQAHLDWLRVLSDVNWAWAPMNGSVAGLFARTLTETPVFVPLVTAPVAARVLAAAAAIAIAATTLTTFTRVDSSARVDESWLGVLLAAQLVSPLGWLYYLPLAIGPAVAFAQSWPGRLPAVRETLLALATPGLFLPLGFAMIGRLHPAGGLTWGSLYTWTTLALWWYVVVDVRTRRAGGYPPPGAFGAR